MRVFLFEILKKEVGVFEILHAIELVSSDANTE